MRSEIAEHSRPIYQMRSEIAEHRTSFNRRRRAADQHRRRPPPSSDFSASFLLHPISEAPSRSFSEAPSRSSTPEQLQSPASIDFDMSFLLPVASDCYRSPTLTVRASSRSNFMFINISSQVIKPELLKKGFELATIDSNTIRVYIDSKDTKLIQNNAHYLYTV
ncbi:hypothetical protein LXL04_028074 [Taraxacum kok-saghyz]